MKSKYHIAKIGPPFAKLRHKRANCQKSYNFGASEFNRKMKRIAQEKLAKGLPVSVGIPNDADAEDLSRLNAFDKWLRAGQPVE